MKSWLKSMLFTLSLCVVAQHAQATVMAQIWLQNKYLNQKSVVPIVNNQKESKPLISTNAADLTAHELQRQIASNIRQYKAAVEKIKSDHTHEITRLETRIRDLDVFRRSVEFIYGQALNGEEKNPAMFITTPTKPATTRSQSRWGWWQSPENQISNDQKTFFRWGWWQSREERPLAVVNSAELVAGNVTAPSSKSRRPWYE